MNLTNKKVTHKAFGNGEIKTFKDGEYIEVKFSSGVKKFHYPDCFDVFLALEDENTQEEVNRELQKKKMEIKLERDVRVQNMKTRLLEEKPKSSLADGTCLNIAYKGDYKEGNFYENQELREWKVMAGEVRSGDNRGKPVKMTKCKVDSICILTMRNPQEKEKDRFIYAAFLIDSIYKGSVIEQGYVTTDSKYKLVLTPEQAEKMLFWNYHANDKNPLKATWSQGSRRYIRDIEAAQILRDIVRVKEGAEDEELAKEFLDVFCQKNRLYPSQLEEAHGMLRR